MVSDVEPGSRARLPGILHGASTQHLCGAGVLHSVSDNSHLLVRSERSEPFCYVALRYSLALSGRDLRIQRHISGKAT